MKAEFILRGDTLRHKPVKGSPVEREVREVYIGSDGLVVVRTVDGSMFNYRRGEEIDATAASRTYTVNAEGTLSAEGDR